MALVGVTQPPSAGVAIAVTLTACVTVFSQRGSPIMPPVVDVVANGDVDTIVKSPAEGFGKDNSVMPSPDSVKSAMSFVPLKL